MTATEETTVSKLAETRTIAAAATPGMCSGPAESQTAHVSPHGACPECGPDLYAFRKAFQPEMVLVMLDALEAAEAYVETPPHTRTLGQAEDLCGFLARVYDLMGDNDD